MIFRCFRASDDARNNRKLLDALSAFPHPHTGRFRCCMALVRPGKADLVRHGVWEGVIVDAPSGNNGFGYDPLFFDPELGRISGELTREEKKCPQPQRQGIAPADPRSGRRRLRRVKVSPA